MQLQQYRDKATGNTVIRVKDIEDKKERDRLRRRAFAESLLLWACIETIEGEVIEECILASLLDKDISLDLSEDHGISI